MAFAVRAKYSLDKKVYFLYLFAMKFEYDCHKSMSNKIKHGINFEEAKALWDDVSLLVFPLCFKDEVRYACVGNVHGKIWTAVITLSNKAVRIISVRLAHKDEEKAYEGK